MFGILRQARRQSDFRTPEGAGCPGMWTRDAVAGAASHSSVCSFPPLLLLLLTLLGGLTHRVLLHAGGSSEES
jgi:hypothetical protein